MKESMKLQTLPKVSITYLEMQVWLGHAWGVMGARSMRCTTFYHALLINYTHQDGAVVQTLCRAQAEVNAVHEEEDTPLLDTLQRFGKP